MAWTVRAVEKDLDGSLLIRVDDFKEAECFDFCVLLFGFCCRAAASKATFRILYDEERKQVMYRQEGGDPAQRREGPISDVSWLYTLWLFSSSRNQQQQQQQGRQDAELVPTLFLSAQASDRTLPLLPADRAGLDLLIQIYEALTEMLSKATDGKSASMPVTHPQHPHKLVPYDGPSGTYTCSQCKKLFEPGTFDNVTKRFRWRCLFSAHAFYDFKKGRPKRVPCPYDAACLDFNLCTECKDELAKGGEQKGEEKKTAAASAAAAANGAIRRFCCVALLL